MGVEHDSLAAWVDLVHALLERAPRPRGFPHEDVVALLRSSFEAECCTFHAVGPTWVDRVERCWPVGRLPDAPPGGPPDATRQPLLRWYALTLSTGPQTLGRVPPGVADRRLQASWQDVLRPFGLSAQLSLPVLLDADGARAYVLTRPGHDYDEREWALAHLVQPALSALFAQHDVLARAAPPGADGAAAAGLTARETAVLALLADGLTARAIAHRLGTSPRTVHKHLEHLYRKIGVGDRLVAVRTARAMGLLPTGAPVP
ncbi:response regulator transcription factor [Kineococcus gypseus]|uniref:helix-turn-helix transcriptional regulator n=1 Tax=Kineococcus gypseus TaxID=1637102 RepID=UPI003D7DC88E